MPLDKNPLVVKEFKGLLLTDIRNSQPNESYSEEKVPFDYALECTNFEFLKKGGMRTRKGVNFHINIDPTTGRAMQMWQINNLNGVIQSDRWLILTWDSVGGNGYLYDTGAAVPTTPVLTLSGMKYAFVINAFGRMYITPWSAWATPLSGASVHVYNGLYNARATKAAAPVVTGPPAMAVAAAAGGNCTPGLHYVSILYETDTGYITICPTAHLSVPLSVTTTAANATINGTNVPLGPTGTVKRHIIITKVVVNANGEGLLGYEPFIALTINNNTATTFSFTRPDSALVDSAKDYIEDNTAIPACVSLATFGNRLVYIGPRPTNIQDSILVSPPNRPEQVDTTYTSLLGATVNEIQGVSTINVGPDFSGKPMIGAELNNNFYVFKEDSTFGINPNDELDPIEWDTPVLIDGGKGAYPFAIASVGNNPGSTKDGYLVVGGNHGITIFNGGFAQHSIVEALQDKLYKPDFKWVKILIDPIRQNVLFRIGDPNSDTVTDTSSVIGIQNNFIYVGNYYYGQEITQIRWGKYTYPDSIVTPDPLVTRTTVVVDLALTELSSVSYPVLAILDKGVAVADILRETTTNGVDFTLQYVDWILETGYTPNKNGEVYTFGPLKLRIAANTSSPIVLKSSTLDDTVLTSIGSILATNISLTPKKYFSFNVNTVSEHARIKITGNALVILNALILHMTVRSLERPRE